MTRYILAVVGAAVSFAGILPGIPVIYWTFGLIPAALVGVVAAYACWVCLGWVETLGIELGRARRRQMPRARVLVDWEGGL